MLLQVTPPGSRPSASTHLRCNPLVPEGSALAFADLEPALRAEYVELDHRAWTASPLQLVTGLSVRGEPEASRLLELVCVGSLPGVRPGSGSDLVERAAEWLRERSDALAQFVGTVLSLLIREPISPESHEHLDRLARQATPTIPWEVGDGWILAYEADDVTVLAAIEFGLHWSYGAAFGVCEHCGCLFKMAARTDEIYCGRPAPGMPPGGRTCKEIGAQAKFARDIDVHNAAYRQTFKRLDKVVRRRGLDRTLLDAWRSSAMEMRKQAEASAEEVSVFQSALDRLAIELGIV